MIMIDYPQLMWVPSLSENRTLEIAEIPLIKSLGERAANSGYCLYLS